jgi:hypothetical protein
VRECGSETLIRPYDAGREHYREPERCLYSSSNEYHFFFFDQGRVSQVASMISPVFALLPEFRCPKDVKVRQAVEVIRGWSQQLPCEKQNQKQNQEPEAYSPKDATLMRTPPTCACEMQDNGTFQLASCKTCVKKTSSWG